MHGLQGARRYIAAALILSAFLSAFVVGHWGWASFVPGLVGQFAASLVAFMLALAWERDRERDRSQGEAARLQQQRVSEIRRRFSPVRVELEKNHETTTFLTTALDPMTKLGQPGVQMFHPQLLEGAWAANAPRLSELVADYELISDLAVTYGRIEELRWRLRYRSENLGARDLIDGMTLPLVVELDSEITNLVQRVEKQIQSPAAQPLGLAHFGKIESTLTMTSTLEAALIPGTSPATTAEPPADDADG